MNDKVNRVRMDDVDVRMQPLGEQIREAVGRVVASGQYAAGAEVKALEEEVAAFVGARYGVSCGSGADAMLLSLMAAGVGPGDGVITSPYSDYCAAGAIHRLGAVPVFIDIISTSYHLCDEYVDHFMEGKHPLNAKLDMPPEGVKAIIAEHTFGEMCDMEPYRYYSEEWGIPVIENVAGGIGAAGKAGKAGSVGTMGCIRLGSGGEAGEAGMVTTSDPEVARRLRGLRDNPQQEDPSDRISKQEGFTFYIGCREESDQLDIAGDLELKMFADLIKNSAGDSGSATRDCRPKGGSGDARYSVRPLTELQAALLRVTLKKVRKWNSYRQETATKYYTCLYEEGILGDVNIIHFQQNLECNLNGESLKGHQDKIFLPYNIELMFDDGVEQTYTRFVVRTAARKELAAAFQREGIDYEIPVPEPLHLTEAFQRWEYSPWDCPDACRCSSTTIGLPIYPMMPGEDVEKVVKVMKEVVEG